MRKKGTRTLWRLASAALLLVLLSSLVGVSWNEEAEAANSAAARLFMDHPEDKIGRASCRERV